MSILLVESTRPSFLGRFWSFSGLFLAGTPSHQGLEGFHVRVPNSNFKVGTGFCLMISKTSKNQLHQGVIRF